MAICADTHTKTQNTIAFFFAVLFNLFPNPPRPSRPAHMYTGLTYHPCLLYSDPVAMLECIDVLVERDCARASTVLVDKVGGEEGGKGA